jgi:hypothetical protein
MLLDKALIGGKVVVRPLGVVITEIELLLSMKWGFHCIFNSCCNMDLLMTVLKSSFVS